MLNSVKYHFAIKGSMACNSKTDGSSLFWDNFVYLITRHVLIVLIT